MIAIKASTGIADAVTSLSQIFSASTRQTSSETFHDSYYFYKLPNFCTRVEIAPFSKLKYIFKYDPRIESAFLIFTPTHASIKETIITCSFSSMRVIYQCFSYLSSKILYHLSFEIYCIIQNQKHML